MEMHMSQTWVGISWCIALLEQEEEPRKCFIKNAPIDIPINVIVALYCPHLGYLGFQ